MKKFLLILLVAVTALTMIVAPAIAEGVNAEPTGGVNWAEILSYLLYSVVTAVAAIITKYIVPYLKAVVAEKATSIQNERLRRGIEDANDAVFTAVTATMQTYVDNVKSEGMFDEAAQREAFNKAYGIASNLLTDAAKSALEAMYGGVDEWLTNKIEQTVKETKDGAAIAGTVY